MPSQSKPTRGDICVFGDSHLGAVKLALDAGLIETEGRKVVFWGADGPNFRALRWKKGQIVPDPAARNIVAKVNGGTHATLAPDDFKTFIFYGARLRVNEFFAAMLPYLRRPEGQLSSAALVAVVDSWTNSTRAWRLAKLFSVGDAQVVFVPTSLPTMGVAEPEWEAANLQQVSTKAERDFLWTSLTDAAQRGGFALLPQPEATVTDKTLTLSKYAIEGANEARDYVHKSPAYAALMVKAALAQADRAHAAQAAAAE